jgi:hypothetical protein
MFDAGDDSADLAQANGFGSAFEFGNSPRLYWYSTGKGIRNEFRRGHCRPHQVEGTPDTVHRQHRQRKAAKRHICKDDLCDLGKWIYGDAIKHLPQYEDVLKKHANFHMCAAAFVAVESNDTRAAKSALAGPFAIASKETVTAIMELKREAAKGGPALTSQGYVR